MSAKIDVSKFWDELNSCSGYEDFQRVYSRFRDMVFKADEKKRKMYYQEIYQRVDKVPDSARMGLPVWKKDFLEAWELLKPYDAWVSDMADSREDNEKESRRNLLGQILELLKEHQGVKREGKKDYLILRLCVDVFFSYGEPEYGINLASAMCEMMKRAGESDEECREYYGEPARDIILKRTVDNLQRKNVTRDHLKNILAETGKKSLQQFVRKILEQRDWGQPKGSEAQPRMQGQWDSGQKDTVQERRGQEYREQDRREQGRSEQDRWEQECREQGRRGQEYWEQETPAPGRRPRRKNRMRRVVFLILLLVFIAVAAAGGVFFLFMNRDNIRNMLFPARENGQVQEIQENEGGGAAADSSGEQEGLQPADTSEESPLSAEILRRTAEDFESRESLACTVVLTGDLTVGGRQVDTMIQMSAGSTDGLSVIHRSVNSSTASDGRMEVNNMEIYEEASDDGGYDVYCRSGDTWTKGQEGSGKEGLGSKVFQALADNADQFSVSEYPDSLSGETYYILTGEIDGGAFAECIPAEVSALFDDTDLSPEEVLPEEGAMSGCAVPCSVWINSSTMLPESVSADLTEAVGMQQASSGNTVERYWAEITYTSYDSLEPIRVPEEVRTQPSDIVISSEGEE